MGGGKGSQMRGPAGLGSQAASAGAESGLDFEPFPVLIRSGVRSPKKLRTRKLQTEAMRSQVFNSSSIYAELEPENTVKCWVFFRCGAREVSVFQSPVCLSYGTLKNHRNYCCMFQYNVPYAVRTSLRRVNRLKRV